MQAVGIKQGGATHWAGAVITLKARRQATNEREHDRTNAPKAANLPRCEFWRGVRKLVPAVREGVTCVRRAGVGAQDGATH